MTTLLVLTLFLSPLTAFAADDRMTIRDHTTLRTVDRLERFDYYGQRNSLIRLGMNVRTRRISPRRMQPQTLGTVTDVIDGSVVVVDLETGEEVVVRTLGAEAPLLETGSDKEQCYALAAKDALTSMVLGKDVALEKDRNYQYDQEGRLLRYVRVNSLDVNGWMIWNGFAFADDEHPHQRWEDYHDRETDARDADRGMWSDYCTYNPEPRRAFEIIE